MTTRLSPTQARLLDDLHAGADLRRRGLGRPCPDANHWLGARTRLYTDERRATADALVARGLARWVPISDPHAALATHRLIPTAFPPPPRACQSGRKE